MAASVASILTPHEMEVHSADTRIFGTASTVARVVIPCSAKGAKLQSSRFHVSSGELPDTSGQRESDRPANQRWALRDSNPRPAECNEVPPR